MIIEKVGKTSTKGENIDAQNKQVKSDKGRRKRNKK